MKENEIEMSKKDFVKEHKHLISVLMYGKKKDQVKEAKDQAKELKSKE